MNSKITKKLISSSVALALLAGIMVPQVRAEGLEDLGKYTATDQPAASEELHPVAKVKNTIVVNGKDYKDLNNNGALDPYENWGLPVADRVADLVSKMTLEEKAGMLLITEFPKFDANNKLVLPNAMLDQNTRYYIFRASPAANVIADYNNQIQQEAEKSRLGIPAVIISNPRNHTSTDYTNNAGGTGALSFWPGSLGLAATGDGNLAKQFGQAVSEEWRAAGIRKVYGYAADVATDPLWARFEETFGEDPALVGKMIGNVIKGFQGDKLGSNSVAITVKHFPGGGARDNGKDPHFADGNYNPYPTEGSLQKYHFPPFMEAIAAGVSSIMPYYAYPSNEHSAEQGLDDFAPGQQFEQVGFALNKQFMTDFLRGKLGFKGYVNSDTGAVGKNAWGAENLTDPEKMAKALNAGTNAFSGATNPQFIIDAVKNNLTTVDKVNQSVSFLLSEMMNLGLFENPYVDPANALKVANNEKVAKLAYEAHQKSVVLLRNDSVDGKKLLPLDDTKIGNVKLYVEVFPGGDDKDPAKNTNALKAAIKNSDSKVTIVDKLEDATNALVWVKPVQSNWDNNPRITVGPETGVKDVARIVQIENTVPTIAAINMTNPWLINEIEPNASAVFATFGVKPEALLDVIRGRFNPTGKLPFTVPANKQAVDNEKGDVPGYDEAATYAYVAKTGEKYAFGHGLSYAVSTNPQPSSNAGGELPKTSTNLPNITVLGLAMAALGSIILLFQSKRKVNN